MDVIRSSLVANSDAEVTRAVNEIYKRFKVIHNSEQKGDYESLRKEKLLHKDRFKSPKGEYRDHLFLIELEPGIIAEIQVHRADILHSKEIGPGHKVYEDTRILEESKLVKTNAQAKQHHSMLFGHMNKYYKSSQDYRTYEERPAAMRSASSLLMSIAPDSMNVNSVMRSMSDKGSSISTRLAKPGPISQGYLTLIGCIYFLQPSTKMVAFQRLKVNVLGCSRNTNLVYLPGQKLPGLFLKEQSTEISKAWAMINLNW